MKGLRETYFSIQATLFPVLEEEKIKISGKISAEEIAEVSTVRLDVRQKRLLKENLVDLPQGRD